MRFHSINLFTVAALGLVAEVQAQNGNSFWLEVKRGIVSFQAVTNVSAINIHGQSSAVQGQARVHREAAQLVVEEVQAIIKIDTLTTGMSLRDEHMRKNIFAAGDGKIPDLQFTGGTTNCPLPDGKETVCKYPGKLSIRGVDRPVVLTVKLKNEGTAESFRASADATVKLSDYGIERPSQLGVTVADEVKIHLDLFGKAATQTVAGRRNDR